MRSEDPWSVCSFALSPFDLPLPSLHMFFYWSQPTDGHTLDVLPNTLGPMANLNEDKQSQSRTRTLMLGGSANYTDANEPAFHTKSTYDFCVIWARLTVSEMQPYRLCHCHKHVHKYKVMITSNYHLRTAERQLITAKVFWCFTYRECVFKSGQKHKSQFDPPVLNSSLLETLSIIIRCGGWTGDDVQTIIIV